jgi:hypothetical protein
MLPQDVVDRVTTYIQHQAGKSRGAVIDLVRTSQQRYLDVISAIDDAAAATKSAPDEWSVRELLRHVILAEQDVTALVRDLSRGAIPPPTITGRRGIGAMIDDGAQPFSALVEQLRDVNGAMLHAIEELPDAPNLEMKAPHPFFGPLNCMEWAVFQRVHDEDHVQHAQKILAATA